MDKPCVLLSGPVLSQCLPLQLALQKDCTIMVCYSTDDIFAALGVREAAVVLLELAKGAKGKAAVKGLLRDYPHIRVIVFNGNGDNQTFVHAFSSGVADAFRLRGLSASGPRTVGALVGLICDRVRRLLQSDKAPSSGQVTARV